MVATETTNVPAVSLADMIAKAQPNRPEFELCFFVVSTDAVVRWKTDLNGFWTSIEQVTYRCGSCAAPVTNRDEMLLHFQTHADAWKRLQHAIAPSRN